MEREWSCYRSEHFNGGRENNVSEVVSLMEGEWSCYGGGQFNGERMVVTEGASLIERE